MLWAGGSWGKRFSDAIVLWGKISSGMGLEVFWFSWLGLLTLSSSWAVLWSVSSGASRDFAVSALWAIESCAIWELLVWGVDDDWGPLCLELKGLILGNTTSKLHETSGRWMLFVPCWLVEKWWSIIHLNQVLLVEGGHALFLHLDVLAKVLGSLKTISEKHGVWKARDTFGA